MDPLIISAIISAIILIILYKFAKGVLRLVGFIFFIFTILLAITAVFVFLDVSDYKSHSKEKSTMLLVKNDIIVAGISFSLSSENTLPPAGISKESLDSFNAALQSKDFEVMKNDSYKLYLIDYGSIADELSFAGEELSEQRISDILDSEQTEQTAKNILLSALVFDKMSEDPMFIFSGYRKNSIIIYPQTAMFLFIKYVPQLVLDKAAFYSQGTTTKTSPIIAGNGSQIKYDRIN